MLNQATVVDGGRQVQERRTQRKRVFFLNMVEKAVHDYYTQTRILGKGTYTCVCEAINKKTGKTVAIKTNKQAFQDFCDAKRILR